MHMFVIEMIKTTDIRHIATFSTRKHQWPPKLCSVQQVRYIEIRYTDVSRKVRWVDFQKSARLTELRLDAGLPLPYGCGSAVVRRAVRQFSAGAWNQPKSSGESS